jgi:hypothetical protein
MTGYVGRDRAACKLDPIACFGGCTLTVTTTEAA